MMVNKSGVGFGAFYPKFAPFAGEEPTDALPQYDGIVTLGEFISGNLSLELASGKLYADDKLFISVEEFTSGTIALEITDLPVDVAKVVFGLKDDGSDTDLLIYRGNDSRPYGGFSFVQTILDKGTGKTFYRAYYYPKVQAVLSNETVQTKGGSLSFGTRSFSLTVFACNFEDQWRQVKQFEEKEDAAEWAEKQLGVTTR